MRCATPKNLGLKLTNLHWFVGSFLIFVFYTSPAQAQRHEDMFLDKHWASYDRPWVPSDGIKSPDMLDKPPIFLNPPKDIFDRIRPVMPSTNKDMFPKRSGPAPIIPYSPIFTDDAWTK
ncbi:MAG TPA: hypothetical protein DD400_06140 [Rhodospirillaceae bacterium]|nr:hypothetical protein [Rhodospirillaceae bacterium]